MGGIVQGLFIEGALYNEEELLKFLKSKHGLKHVTPDKRWIDIGLTNFLTGEYKDLKSEDLVGDDFYNAIYAEFAYAGFFKPVKSQDTELLSGSTLWDVDIMSVVNKCKETYQDEDIVLDVLLTSQRTLPVIDAHGLTAVNMLWRYLEISSYYTAVDGLLRAKYAFPNITFRNIVSPSERLPSSIKPLQLDQPDIDSMIALGEKDGKASAAAGP